MEEIIKPIGFFVEGKNIVVANPCTIPIEMMEKAIKQAKKNKNGVIAVFCIKIPLPKRFKN